MLKIQSNLHALGKNDPAHARTNEKKPAPGLTVTDKTTAPADSLRQSGENLAAAGSRITDAEAAKDILAFVRQNLPSQDTNSLIKDSEESRARIIDLATN